MLSLRPIQGRTLIDGGPEVNQRIPRGVTVQAGDVSGNSAFLQQASLSRFLRR